MALVRRVLTTNFTASDVKKVEKIEAELAGVYEEVGFDVPLPPASDLARVQFRTDTNRLYIRAVNPLDLGRVKTLCLTGRMVLGTRNDVTSILRSIGGYYEPNAAYASALIVGATTGILKIRAAVDRNCPIYSESQFIHALMELNRNNTYTSLPPNSRLWSLLRSAVNIQMVETYIRRV